MSAATQNVDHCTRRRRSYHHWVMVTGSASSKASLRITRRSCQYSNLLSWRASAVRGPHFMAFSSNWKRVFCLRYHFFTSLLCSGRRRARVWRVSSTRPGGNTLLCFRQLPFSLGGVMEAGNGINWAWTHQLLQYRRKVA